MDNCQHFLLVINMLLLVLFALLSLAAAQCGNSCKCGVTTCCQNTYSSGSPYSIFNLGNNQQYSYAQQYGSGQQYGNSQQYGSSARVDAARTACLKTDEIPFSTKNLYQNQPVFIRVVPNTDDYRQIDNICLTYFPLPDDSTTYVNYKSTVYCDGSNSVRSFIKNDVGAGTALKGNAYSSTYIRIFASLGNNIVVGCSQDAYEDADIASVFALSLGSVSPLGGCVQQIQNIVQCVGQGQADGLYVLPYRLPTRCVTQQVCTLFNPLLYTNNNIQYGSSNNGCESGRC